MPHDNNWGYCVTFVKVEYKKAGLRKEPGLFV